MHTYENFPPTPYLLTILKSCPKAAWVYILLWQSMDDDYRVVCNKQDIRRTFLISPTVFRNTLMNLVGYGLISMQEKWKEQFEIDLVGFDAEDFDTLAIS